jgi:uncharacterized delta-60 repeat protein
MVSRTPSDRFVRQLSGRPTTLLKVAVVLVTLMASPNMHGQQTAGALDPSFGSGGRVITDFAGGIDEAFAVAAYPGRKIIVAGQTRSPGSATDIDIALARYTHDGDLDQTFGEDGLVTSDFNATEVVRAVAVQPDGRIILAGTVSRAVGDNDFALVRYERDGRLDSSFGVGGLLTTDFYNTVDDAMDVAILPNGDIAVVGTVNWSATSLDTDFGLALYDRDGNLKQAFGSDGKVTLDFGSIHDFAAALAVTASGDVVVGGVTTRFVAPGQIDQDFAVARFDRDGSLDLSFGVGGRVITDFTASEGLSDIALTRDGEIVAVGTVFPAAGGFDFVVAQYTREGSLDASFGQGGSVFTDFANGGDFAFAVDVHPNGTILVAGRTNDSMAPQTFDDFAVARYHRNGTLDQTFGSGGLVVTDFANDEARAVVILPGNRFVAAGHEWDGQSSVNFAVVGYEWK